MLNVNPAKVFLLLVFIPSIAFSIFSSSQFSYSSSISVQSNSYPNSYPNTYQHPSNANSYRSSFKSCCAIGRQAANSSSTCDDFSRLTDQSSGCRYAYTICCMQNRRVNECERGKKHAYAGLSCEELKSEATCDSLTVRINYLIICLIYCLINILFNFTRSFILTGMLQLLRAWRPNEKKRRRLLSSDRAQ
jgi:hypothetical protein